MALRDLSQTGHVVGRIYAVSTVGSILGTFAAGFFLIARFEAVRFSSASRLCCCSCAAAAFRRKILVVAVIPFAAACVFAARSQSYSHARDRKCLFQRDELLHNSNRAPAKARWRWKSKLVLDRLVHSLNDPAFAVLPGLRISHIFDELCDGSAAAAALDILFIGGGGTPFRDASRSRFRRRVSTSPRLIRKSRSRIPVHGSSTKHARPHSEHRRSLFLMRTDRTYDSSSRRVQRHLVPYHLTTREFIEMQKRHLKPNGVIATNIIDNVPLGDLSTSYLATTRAVFGDAVTVGHRDTTAAAHSRLWWIGGAHHNSTPCG